MFFILCLSLFGADLVYANARISKYLCEKRSVDIYCGQREYIEIISVHYGVLYEEKCPKKANNFYVPHADTKRKEALVKKCNGKRECSYRLCDGLCSEKKKSIHVFPSLHKHTKITYMCKSFRKQYKFNKKHETGFVKDYNKKIDKTNEHNSKIDWYEVSKYYSPKTTHGYKPDSKKDSWDDKVKYHRKTYGYGDQHSEYKKYSHEEDTEEDTKEYTRYSSEYGGDSVEITQLISDDKTTKYITDLHEYFKHGSGESEEIEEHYEKRRSHGNKKNIYNSHIAVPHNFDFDHIFSNKTHESHKKKCREHERLEWRPTSCPETCPPQKIFFAPCTKHDGYQCVCKEGYVRDHKTNRCVIRDRCPYYNPHHPDQYCHEEFNECGSCDTCPKKCGEPVFCTLACIPGYYCKKGYCRNKLGICVQNCKKNEFYDHSDDEYKYINYNPHKDDSDEIYKYIIDSKVDHKTNIHEKIYDVPKKNEYHHGKKHETYDYIIEKKGDHNSGYNHEKQKTHDYIIEKNVDHNSGYKHGKHETEYFIDNKEHHSGHKHRKPENYEYIYKDGDHKSGHKSGKHKTHEYIINKKSDHNGGHKYETHEYLIDKHSGDTHKKHGTHGYIIDDNGHKHKKHGHVYVIDKKAEHHHGHKKGDHEAEYFVKSGHHNSGGTKWLERK